jgi:hypothetical protein
MDFEQHDDRLEKSSELWMELFSPSSLPDLIETLEEVGLDSTDIATATGSRPADVEQWTQGERIPAEQRSKLNDVRALTLQMLGYEALKQPGWVPILMTGVVPADGIKTKMDDSLRLDTPLKLISEGRYEEVADYMDRVFS